MGANQVKEATAYFTEFAKHHSADDKQKNAFMSSSALDNNNNSNKGKKNTEGSSVIADVNVCITNEQNNEVDLIHQDNFHKNNVNDEVENEINGMYSREFFLDEIALYSEALNGGMELYSIVEPIAQAIIQFNPQTNRLRWLCTLVSDVLQEVRFTFSNDAFLAESRTEHVSESTDRGDDNSGSNKDEIKSLPDLSHKEKLNDTVNSDTNFPTNIAEHRTQSVSNTRMHSLSINTFMEDSDLSTITACVNALELVFRRLLQVVRGDEQLLLRLIEGNLLLHTQHSYTMKDNSTKNDSKYVINSNNKKEQKREEWECCKVAYRLCKEMISFTIYVECVSHTLPLHAAVMRFLCTLTSTAIHHKINDAVIPEPAVTALSPPLSSSSSIQNTKSSSPTASMLSQSQCEIDVFTQIMLSVSSSLCTSQKSSSTEKKFGELHQLIDVLLERTKWWGTLASFSAFPLTSSSTSTSTKHLQTSSVKTIKETGSNDNSSNKLFIVSASERKMLQSLESFHVMYAAGYSPSLRNMFYWFGNNIQAVIKPSVQSTQKTNSLEPTWRAKVALQSTKAMTENQSRVYRNRTNNKDVEKKKYNTSGSSALQLDNTSINEAVNNTLMLVNAQHKELSKTLTGSSKLPTMMAHASLSEMSNSSVISELSSTLTPLQSSMQQTQGMDTSALSERASNHEPTCESPLPMSSEGKTFVLPPLRVMSSMKFTDKDEWNGALHTSCSTLNNWLRHSTMLLCVLLSYRKAQIANPALRYFVQLNKMNTKLFVELLHTINMHLHTMPFMMMLLYLCIHDHPLFLRSILSVAPPQLLITVRELLYWIRVASWSSNTEYYDENDYNTINKYDNIDNSRSTNINEKTIRKGSTLETDIEIENENENNETRRNVSMWSSFNSQITSYNPFGKKLASQESFLTQKATKQNNTNTNKEVKNKYEGKEDLGKVEVLVSIMHENATYALPFVNFMAATTLFLLLQHHEVVSLVCAQTVHKMNSSSNNSNSDEKEDVNRRNSKDNVNDNTNQAVQASLSSLEPSLLSLGMWSSNKYALHGDHDDADQHTLSHKPSNLSCLTLLSVWIGVERAISDCNETLVQLLLPCITNIARGVHDLDTMTAQRITSLFVRLIRKVKYYDALCHSTHVGEKKSNIADNNNKQAINKYKNESDGNKSQVVSAEKWELWNELTSVYLQHLESVAEIIELLLCGPRRHNETLIYDLLYAKDKILVFDNTSEVNISGTANNLYKSESQNIEHAAHVIINIAELIRNYSKLIEKTFVHHRPNINEIMTLIKHKNRCKWMSHHHHLRQQQYIPLSCVDKQTDIAQLTEKNYIKTDNNAVKTDNKLHVHVASRDESSDDDDNNDSDSKCYYCLSGSDNDSEAEVCLCKESDIVYYYEESPCCYNFFAPFIWSTLLCDGRFPGGITFTRHVRSLRLFQPIPASHAPVTTSNSMHS